MKTKILPLTLLFFITFPLSVMSGELKKVPEKYQGVWAQDMKKCGEFTESYFEITESQTKGWESISDIKSIYEYENSIAFISVSSGEGFTWLNADIFELTNDKNILLNKQAYPNVKYYKCPKS